MFKDETEDRDRKTFGSSSARYSAAVTKKLKADLTSLLETRLKKAGTEVILAVIGLEAIAPARLSQAIVPAGVICFAALEWFGMSFYSIPYYTGFIAHLPNGGLPALGIGQLRNGGLSILIARLTANKPEFLNVPAMASRQRWETWIHSQ